jgi:hypothetical protein
MDLPGMCGLEGTHTCQIGVEIDHESAMMEGNIGVVELEWFVGQAIWLVCGDWDLIESASKRPFVD